MTFSTPKLKQTTSSGSFVQRLVRLLGFGGSTGYVKPDEIPTPPPRKPLEEPEQPEWAKEWDALVDRYPVGAKLEYLGIEMLVVQSRKSWMESLAGLNWSMYGSSDYYYWAAAPIRAEYVDGHGRIREKIFDERTALSFLANDKGEARPHEQTKEKDHE